MIPLSAWGPLTFLRPVLSIIDANLLCYSALLSQAHGGGRLFHLKAYSLRSTLPCTSSYIKMYSQYRRFSENMSSFFEVTNPAFPCSLLHHELCFSHPAINLADSGPAPLPSPPLSLYPISRGSRISSSCHLLPTRPPQFNVPV